MYLICTDRLCKAAMGHAACKVVWHRCKAKLYLGKAGLFLVLIFGIPFPNVKDTKVGLKKAYNDAGQRTHRLLSGDQWYSQQAFRCVCLSVPLSLCLSV